jgi:hypothetical protein
MTRWASTATWAERNVTLDGRPFRREEWPQIVDFLDALDAGTGKTLIAMMPPQRGKTLAAQLHLARNVAMSPRRVVWYSRTSVDSRSISDTKLKPLLDGTDSIRRVRYTDPDSRGRGLLFRFPGAPVELLSAEVQTHRNLRSGQTLYLDEAWQYPERAIAEIFKRADSYGWRRQHVITTTAPDKGHELDILWESSTCHEWHLACPGCGLAFVPRWNNEMFPMEQVADEGKRINVARSSETVRCKPPCGCGPYEWTPALQARMNDRTRGAGYKPTNPNALPDVAGYRFNALATDPWPRVAADWVTAMNAIRAGDPALMREFRIKRLCEAWSSERDENPEAPAIEVGPYNLGDAWADEAKDQDGRPYRFLSVDVQRTHFWAVIRAWAADGRSRLVARSKLLTPHEIEAFAAQHDVPFGRWFEALGPDGREIVTCESRVFLDSKFNTQEVFRICAEHGFHAVNSHSRQSYKHGDGTWRLYDERRLVDPMQGHRTGWRKRVLNFFFAADAAKDRMAVLREQTGIDGLPCWTAAMDSGDEYARQIGAEAKVKVFKADGKTYAYKWKMLSRNNHYFDCETIQIVAASMAGLIGDDAPAPADVAQESS